MIQMNKKSVCRLLGIGAGKWADGLNQGIAPPDQRSGLPTLDRPYDTITAGSSRKGGKWLAGMALTAALLGVGGSIFAQSPLAGYGNTVNATGSTSGPGALRAWSGTTAIDDEHSNMRNDTRAVSDLFQNETSQSLNFTDFDFSSIPTGATIQGIEVRVWKSREQTDGDIVDNRVMLIGASATANKANTSTDWTQTGGASSGTPPFSDYGGTADTWGTTSNAATLLTQVKNSAFGVEIRARRINDDDRREARIHGVRVTISYTLPGSITVMSVTSGASATLPTTVYGTPSGNPTTTVSVAGTGLGSTDITATLNSGMNANFEISKTGGVGTWGNGPLTYNQSSGTVASTDFYVRAKAGADVDGNPTDWSTVSNVVTFSSGSVTPVNLGVSYDVTPKGLTIATLSASDKTYDGDNTVSVTGGGLVTDDILSGDVVSILTPAPTYSFTSKNVGATVSRSANYQLTGGDAGNYMLSAQPAVPTASILAKGLNISVLTADSRAYDGTTNVSVTGGNLEGGIIGEDNVVIKSPAPTYQFDSKNVGATVTRSAIYELDGTDAGNYSLPAQPAVPTASITQAPATVTALADDKCYGDEIAAGVIAPGGRYSVSGLVGGEEEQSVTLASDGFAVGGAEGPHVITPSNLVLAGTALATNYNVNYVNGTLTVTDEVKGTITGAANTSICSGDIASININHLGGGTPTASHPFTGVFKILKAGSTTPVEFPFSIYGIPAAVEIPASYLPATSTTTYTVSWSSLSNNAGCSTSATTSLTGSVVLTVYPVPTIDVTGGNAALCSGSALSMDVTNPNAVSGSVYDLSVDYNGVEGGLYTTSTGRSFSTDIAETGLTNTTDAPINVVYTLTAKKEAAVYCASDPVEKTVTVNPEVTFEAITANIDGEAIEGAAIVCEDAPGTISFTLSGLLPSTDHIATFDIIGAGGMLNQTTEIETLDDGTYAFSAADFNVSDGGPAPGTYTFKLTGLEAHGCDLSISSGNTATITINPTPTFGSVTLAGTSVCEDAPEGAVFTIDGLLADSLHTLTFNIHGTKYDNTEYNDDGQTATLTADGDGVIIFTAADFNDGHPAPGTYTFTLTNLEVAGCSLSLEETMTLFEVEGNNSATVTIKPTPTFDSISASAPTVCVNDLSAESLILHGLLPNELHTINFTVAGAPHTEETTANEFGTITLDANEFVSTVGMYSIVVTGITVNECSFTPTVKNSKSIIVKPTPTIGSFTSTATEICQADVATTTYTVSGLLNGATTIGYSINSGTTATIVRTATEGSVTFTAADILGSTPAAGDYTINIDYVQLAGCMATVYGKQLTLDVNATPTIGTFTVNENSSTSVCVDNREAAIFAINGLLDGANTINYTITEASTEGSITRDYTDNASGGTISFDGTEFTGSGVLPGNYTIAINSVTVGTCVTSVSGMSVNVVFTGTPTAIAGEEKTIYVGEACATTMPNYMPTLNGLSSGTVNENSNLTVTAGEGCSSSNITVEQLAPNAPGSAVIGFGGERMVWFKITKEISNGGTIVLYDSFRLNIADTTRPNVLPETGTIVYLSSAIPGIASISAADLDSASVDNCPDGGITVKAFRGENTPADNVSFSCADLTSPVEVTLQVTDASGNVSTSITEVTVMDNTAPVITGTMGSITVDKGALCTNQLPNYAHPDTLAAHGIVLTDNASCQTLTVTQSPAAGTIIAKSITTQPIVITVKDASNNQATTTFSITYVDNTKPVLAGVPTNKIESTVAGACTKLVELPTVTATDNCTETVAVTSTGIPAGNLFPIGTTKVVYTATDAAGNKAKDSFTVTINPVIAAPVVAGEVPEMIVVNVTEAGVCAATVPAGEWPSFSAPAYPCATAGVTLVEEWSHTSADEFPIGETEVTYTATYTYNGVEYPTMVNFTVSVEDEAAPVLAEIGNQSFNVNAEGCNASIETTGMNVVYSGTCDGEAVNVSWAIAGTEYAGEGQISDRESNIVLPVGDYTVTYTVEDASGNPATTSFEIMVINPLDAMIEGTATVVKNALTTSTVKFTGEGGLAPYNFTYNVYVNGETTPSTVGATVSTLAGSDAVTVAQPNSAVGTFRYEVVSVSDANGCAVLADETHIFTRNATITVIEPTSADISMNVRIAPATLKSNGTAREVNFRLTNIGGSATTSGVVSFVVTKPRADVGGVPTSTLTATTAGWEVVPHANPSLWTVRSTSAVSIAGGNTLQEVKCNLTYTGAAKGAATVTAKLPNGAVGDSNNTNNSNTKSIIIN